jgi:Fe-S-cluster containining protein
MVARVELAVVSLCDGCGKCCEHIGMPPFEVRNPDLGPDPRQELTPVRAPLWVSVADAETFDRMPRELRAEHAAALLALKDNPTGRPCLWQDAETKRCRHYEFRPAVCRVFEPGDDGCNKVRAGQKCVWQGDNSPAAWLNPRVKPHEPMPWEEPRRGRCGWLRWHLWRKPLGYFRRDRFYGWSVFESVLRRVWLGKLRDTPPSRFRGGPATPRTVCSED